MANKAMIMRYLVSAEPDMVARSERMHVIALPSSDIGQIAEQPRLGDRKILAGRNFQI